MLLITSPRFEEHVTPPGHPERMERAHVFNAAAERWLEKGGHAVPPRAASREELARVHAEEHLDAIAGSDGRAVMLDADTFTSPESYEIALLAAGAAVQAAEHAIELGRIFLGHLVHDVGNGAHDEEPMSVAGRNVEGPPVFRR